MMVPAQLWVHVTPLGSYALWPLDNYTGMSGKSSGGNPCYTNTARSPWLTLVPYTL